LTEAAAVGEGEGDEVDLANWPACRY
jgi:hypothetical protein